MVVDEFGIQYENNGYTKKLLKALKQQFEAVSVDCRVYTFFGITLKWNYKRFTVELIVSGYI